MTVLIAVPVLRRPHRVAPLLESFEAATPEPHRLLFVCTPDDHDEIAAIEAAGADYIVTPAPHMPGDYAVKINLAYRSTTEPLLFLGADDLLPHPGWLERATDRLAPGVGVVGTNDLCNKRTRTQHSTHSLVTRDYIDTFGTIDEPGKVLHEGYPHEFVDDELILTAAHRGAYVHADDCYVEHLHPMNGHASDELYDQQDARMKAGRPLFVERSRLWT